MCVHISKRALAMKAGPMRVQPPCPHSLVISSTRVERSLMHKNKIDNQRRDDILREMAVGHDWTKAVERVQSVADDDNSGDHDTDHPADSVVVAVQQVDHPGFIPNLLYAQGTKEVIDSVERDLQSDTPELSIAELFSGKYDA